MATVSGVLQQVFRQVQSLVKRYPVQIICVLVVLNLLWNKFQLGIHQSQLPGPTVAAYTKLWRVWNVWRGSAHLDAIELHRKYGNLVRIGPNHVSVADPKWTPVFYGSKEEYTKTAFYPIQCISWKKKPEHNLFSECSIEQHRIQKRKVGNAYALPRLLESEGPIDSTVDLLMSRLSEFASQQKPVDLGLWLQYYAFDVVGEITFASKLGFLERGQDVDGMMHSIEGMLSYAAIVGQVPGLHQLLLGNPLLTLLMPAMETWNQVVVFTMKAIRNRSLIDSHGELLSADSSNGKDMLSRWAHVKGSNPDKMSTKDVVVALSGNVFAGSDTTAIALRAIIYYLCRYPRCMEKLVKDIDDADRAGKLSSPISFKESNDIPYLIAVLKESMRLHPSVGLLMERHVPAQGVNIDGYFLKAGTIVGINPWVVNRNPEIFADPDEFRPERWLEASAPLKAMDNAWELNFGAGARKCIGRNISWIEMMKVIPELLRQYIVELTDPKEEWSVMNHWFTQQKGVVCNLRRRQ